MCCSRQSAVNRVKLKGLRDLKIPFLPSSLSAKTMQCFPVPQQPSIPLYLCLKSQQTAMLLLHFCQRTSILSLALSAPAFIGHHRTSSILSAEQNPPTLPSCGSTPLPSISLHSPPEQDWDQYPPSFLSSMSTPPMYPSPLSLLL